jgi:hypothetical protein
MNKEQLDKLKLKEHEWAQLNEFIKKCVHGNIMFKIISLKPITQTANIQELLHEFTVSTLEGFVTGLETLLRKEDASRLKKDKTFYTGTVTIDELADILVLIIRNKDYKGNVGKVKSQLEQIQSQLADLETPEEKRTRLLKVQSELLNIT